MDDSSRVIFAESAVTAVTTPPRRRLFRRNAKAHPPPLPYCENCLAPMHGGYCSKCGQHAIDYRRSVGAVIADAADSFFNWDAKFLKSIGTLLVAPWRLTNDFNAGRRVRYVHPLRLYLLASIAFFLVVRLVHIAPENVIHFDPQDRAAMDSALAKLAAPDSGLSEDDRREVELARANLPKLDGPITPEQRAEMIAGVRTLMAAKLKEKKTAATHEKIAKALERINSPALASPPASGASPRPKARGKVFTFGATPPPGSTPGLNIWVTPPDTHERSGWFENLMESRIKTKIGENGAKIGLFLDTLRGNLPTMMLFCIPLFALVLKILYIRKQRYYVEHLIYALHVHSFIYLAAVIIGLLAVLLGRWSPVAKGLEIGVLTAAAVCLLFLTIRRVYQQSWFVSIIKFLFGGLAYLIILSVGIALTVWATLLLPG